MIKSFDLQPAPGERFRRQALLYAVREREIFFDFFLPLFQKLVRGAKLFLRALLFRNVGKADDRESTAVGIFHVSRAGDHRQPCATFRGKKKLVAYPAQRVNFPAPFANERYVFRPVINEERVLTQDFIARYSRHFLEDRVDEDYMLAIVDEDRTLVQRFENAGHLVEPFGLFEFQENPRTPAHSVDVHLTQSWPERQSVCLLGFYSSGGGCKDFRTTVR